MSYALTIMDFKKGFKYKAWVGYEWVDCEYGKNGFSKYQLKIALDKGLIKRLLQVIPTNR